MAELTGFILRSLGEPSEARPTVRCISRTTALSLISQAHVAIAEPELSGVTATELLQTLETSNILQPLPLTRQQGISVYAVGPQSLNAIDPIELLEAVQPAGVVCYFTALHYYGLTTQIPAHHHIARLVRRLPAKPREKTVVSVEQRATLSVRQRDLLGKRLFDYQSVPYYQTSRGAHTIGHSGVQLRQLSDKSIARITTKEQTLLDTLHRPISCGGPSIVWEAWAQGLAEFDEARLTQHLNEIGDSKLVRRVGYMLSANAYEPGSALAGLLDLTRKKLAEAESPQHIALLPGIVGTGFDPIWQLELATA